MIAMGDIKLAHSVFALPFAILGVFLARPEPTESPSIFGILTLVVLCMIFARNWAMLVNRVVDADIDKENPRTVRRAFASGALSLRDGYMMLGLNAIAFIGVCTIFGFMFNNWWPTILSIPVLLWIGFYSLTKRFTWLCHLFLGGALAISPLASAIAINPDSLTQIYSLYWIASMVLCWVGGFDVIYALQDLEFDQDHGLSSIPSRFGWKGASWISRALHVCAIGCLIGAHHADDRLDLVFGIGVGLVTLVLIYEHLILFKRGKEGIPMAFFTLNGIVSLILGASGCIDILWI